MPEPIVETPETHDPRALESWRNNLKWKEEFTPFTYYKFLREEIRREDELTHQRITWSMQFQSFLVAAVAVLINSSNWTKAMPDISRLQLLALPAMGLMGVAVAWVTWGGVNASRQAIDTVKEYWEKYNAELLIIPSWAPRTYGEWRQHQTGSSYVWCIPVTFFFFWLFYLVALLFVVFAPRFKYDLISIIMPLLHSFLDQHP